MAKYYVILHLIVFIWGFTGILGDVIELPAEKITFFRTALAFIFALFMGLFYRKRKRASQPQKVQLFLTGIIVGLHWFFFFLAIKLSTVSIGVICMSSSTLFTSILEPILFKRKFSTAELVLSFCIIAGITIIFGFETGYAIGILCGLLSAFLAALFTVKNGKFMQQKINPLEITTFEMLGGALIMLIFVFVSGNVNSQFFVMSMSDFIYLLLLSSVCTSIAFLVSVWVMKKLSPFTVSISINMEPIYTILIVVLYGVLTGVDTEIMSTGFYVGSLIIVGSIFTNAIIKRRTRLKLKKT